MCEMSYEQGSNHFKPVRQNTKPVLGLTSGLRALRAVRSEQLLGSFGNPAAAGPKHSTYASPPINLLKSCD